MKTVIEMAREAGMNLTPAQFSGVLEDEVDEFQLERFAELVRADERKRADRERQVAAGLARLEEREAIRAVAQPGQQEPVSKADCATF